MLDVSASQLVGKQQKSKLTTLKEVAGVLIFSAMQEASHIGFCAYPDLNEKFIAPGAGKKHGFKTISEIFKLEPVGTGTDLKGGLKFTLQALKRKSLVFILSDFIDENYQDLLRALAQKHDLVVIHLQDDLESELPKMGIVPVYDPERRQTTWVNTSASSFREQLKENINAHAVLKNQCKQWQADYVGIPAGEDFVPALVKLFNVRK